MTLQEKILALSVAYAVLGAVLLLAVTRSHLHWLFKVIAVTLTGAFYAVSFVTMEGLLGWSAPQALPAQFRLLWVRTIEPDPGASEPGSIHLWLEEVGPDNIPIAEPRAYRLRYSAKLGRRVEAARAEIQAGHPQGGRAADFATDEVNSAARVDAAGVIPGGDPSPGGILDSAFLGSDSQSIQFGPMPSPTLPPKPAR